MGGPRPLSAVNALSIRPLFHLPRVVSSTVCPSCGPRAVSSEPPAPASPGLFLWDAGVRVGTGEPGAARGKEKRSRGAHNREEPQPSPCQAIRHPADSSSRLRTAGCPKRRSGVPPAASPPRGTLAMGGSGGSSADLPPHTPGSVSRHCCSPAPCTATPRGATSPPAANTRPQAEGVGENKNVTTHETYKAQETLREPL